MFFLIDICLSFIVSNFILEFQIFFNEEKQNKNLMNLMNLSSLVSIANKLNLQEKFILY